MLALLPAFLLLSPPLGPDVAGLGSTHNSFFGKAPSGLALEGRFFAQLPAKIEICRGTSILPGIGLPDQDIEETVLDSSEPDASHGGFYTLDAGPTKTLLIRFGQLKRYLAHTGGVAEAELVLTPESETKPILKSAARLLKPWGQGPALRLSDLIKAGSGKAATPGVSQLQTTDSLPATWGSATWRESRFGVTGSRWQSPGAHGVEDSEPIPGAQIVMTDEGAVIKGLGPAIQAMLKGENDGLALTFDNAVSFYSSANAYAKPILRIVPKAAPASGPDLEVISITEQGGLHATVRNAGTAPAPAFKAVWSVDGVAATPLSGNANLAPGQSQTFDYSVPGHLDAKDHRHGQITFTVLNDGPGANWSNNSLTYYPAGIAVHLEGASDQKIQEAVSFLNELAFPRSRYSASLDGCVERVKIAPAGPDVTSVTVDANDTESTIAKKIIVAIGAPNLDPALSGPVKAPGFFGSVKSRFPDLTNGGDTRFDAGLLPSTSFTQSGFFSPLELTTPAEPTYLLSPNSVFALNAACGMTGDARAKAISAALSLKPSAAAALRAADAMGRPLGSLVLDLYEATADKPTLSLKTGDDGVVLLPSNFTLPADKYMVVGATLHGLTEWDVLYGWQINAAAQRTAKVAFIDLRYALPAGPPDYTKNLAAERTITDSNNSLPGALAPLVDGQGKTQVSLPTAADGYLEIDLNRDRTLTEIRLTCSPQMWSQFDIVTYNTGQKPADAVLWAKEQNFGFTAAVRGKSGGDGNVVCYRGILTQARYIRIIHRSAQSEPGGLRQIEIFGQQAGQ